MYFFVQQKDAMRIICKEDGREISWKLATQNKMIKNEKSNGTSNRKKNSRGDDIEAQVK